MYACVRVCVHVRARVCARVCVCACYTKWESCLVRALDEHLAKHGLSQARTNITNITITNIIITHISITITITSITNIAIAVAINHHFYRCYLSAP